MEPTMPQGPGEQAEQEKINVAMDQLLAGKKDGEVKELGISYDLSKLNEQTREAILRELEFYRENPPRKDENGEEVKDEVLEQLQNNPLAYFEAKLEELRKHLKRMQTEKPASDDIPHIEKIIREFEEIIADLREKLPTPKLEEPLFKPGEAEKLTNLPREKAIEKIAEKLEVAAEKAKALATLREIIITATRELTEIQRELAVIRENKKKEQETGVKIPETKTFSKNYIKEKAIEILKTLDSVQSIKSVSIEEFRNELILNAEITAKDWGITTDITLTGAHLINQGNGLTIGPEYLLTATKFEGKVKKKFVKNINLVGEKIKEYVEKEEKKKVEKMEIVNGELRVTFK